MPIPTLTLKGTSYRPTPFVSQNTPQYNAANFAPNIDLLEKYGSKVESRENATNALSANITQALSNVNLHESDDAWKAQYIERIQNQINDAAKYGNYSRALEVATKLAGSAANDPELKARERNNILYQNAWNNVKNNTKIDDVTKRRWKSENQFTNKGLYNEKGEFTGGNVWKESWTPVEPIDKDALYDKLKKYVAPEAGSYENVVYMDANGNYTKDYKNGVFGMAYKTATGYKRISSEKYKQALETLWQQEPNAIQALNQEFKDKRFQLTELQKEADGLEPDSQEYKENLEMQDIIKNQITDREGNFIKEKDYFDRQTHPVLDKMAFNHTSKSITVGDAAQNLFKYNQAAQAAAKVEADVQDYLNSSVGEGPMVEEVTVDNYTLANAGVESAYQNLCKLFPMFSQSNSNVYKYMKRGETGKAIELAKKYVSTNTFGLDNTLRSKMMDELNVMEDNLATLNELNKGITDKRDKQAIAFKAAFDGDSVLPDAGNNEFTKGLIDSKNHIFGDDDKIAIKIQTDDSDNEYRLTKALSAAGMSRQQLTESGIEVKNIDGEQYVYIPKTSKYTDRILYGFSNTADDFWHKPGNSSRVYRVNKDGDLSKELIESIPSPGPVSKGVSGAVENIFHQYRKLVNDATSKSTQAIRAAGKMTTVAPVVLYGTKGALDEAITRSYMTHQISTEEYNAKTKKNDDIKNKLIASQSLQNFNVYWDESGQSQTLKKAGNEVKGEISKWLREAKDNKRAFSWQYGSKDGKYGVYVDFGAKLDKNGNAVSDKGTYAGIRVWVPGLLADDAERAAARDTKNRTVSRMAHLQHFKTQHTTVFGNKVSGVYNDGNNTGAKINGNDVSYDEAKQEILRDLDFRQLEGIYQGIRSQTDLNAFAGKDGWLDRAMKEMYPNLQPDSYEFNEQKMKVLQLLDVRNNNNN